MLGANMVLALNQAARIVPSRDVAEPNVARQGAEERNSVSNENGPASDHESLNDPRAQEAFKAKATIDIEIVDATRSYVLTNVSGRANDLFPVALEARMESSA